MLLSTVCMCGGSLATELSTKQLILGAATCSNTSITHIIAHPRKPTLCPPDHASQPGLNVLRVKVRVSVRVRFKVTVRVRVRVRFFVLTRERSADRTRVTVILTSRRYCQTNSAQALKETNRFTQSIPRIHAHTQGCHDATTLYLSIQDLMRWMIR